MDTAPSPIPTYLATIIRGLANAGAGWLVTHSLIAKDQTEMAVGAVLFAAALVWGLIQKKTAHTKLQDAIDAPAGKAV